MSRIYLIGYMGAGKSLIGKELAKRIQWSYVDLDQYIEERLDIPISKIFDIYGENEFRTVESSALNNIKNSKLVVIATGGGTPCFNKNMPLMNKTGMTIYLKVGPGTLVNRLIKDQSDRPLIRNLEQNDLSKFITKNLEEREKYYLKSSLIIDGDQQPENILNEIYYRLNMKTY